MPVYKVKCQNCGYDDNQYLSKDVNSMVMKCPHCMKGVAARKIKTSGFVEGEADGVVGYLTHDNKRNAHS